MGASFKPELVVMESTDIYWKSPYATLERHGLKIAVVNARHVKQVPRRKTDIADAQLVGDSSTQRPVTRWLATQPIPRITLGFAADVKEKLTSIVSGEKNRLHKLLTDAGIRLAVVICDIPGNSARALIKGLLDGETSEQDLRNMPTSTSMPPRKSFSSLGG